MRLAKRPIRWRQIVKARRLIRKHNEKLQRVNVACAKALGLPVKSVAAGTATAILPGIGGFIFHEGKTYHLDPSVLAYQYLTDPGPLRYSV